jgi:hypothetical protein
MIFSRYLNSLLINKGLIALNVISASIAFGLGSMTEFPDAANYIALAENLLNGNFSSNCNSQSCLPDSVRTPGYPFILSLFFMFSQNLFLMKLIQLLFYFITLWLGYKIVIKIAKHNTIVCNIFLIFTAVNIQIPYYAGTISTETFTAFFVTLFFYNLYVSEKRSFFQDALVSSVILAILYYLRPGFLLFPFILLGLSFFKNLKLDPRQLLMQILLFMCMLLPFAQWNHTNHGVFKLTPIGVSGMAALNGFWYFKLPYGYINTYMWNEVVVPDVTNPFKYTNKARELNKLEYEKRWDNFLKNHDVADGCIDKDNLLIYKDSGTCNPNFSQFILKRENFVTSQLFNLIMEEKLLYAQERFYSFIRLFFTGINVYQINPEENILKKLMRVYPFLVTFLSIFLGFFISILFLRKSKAEEIRYFVPMMMIILYVAASHSIFPIQARYLVPMHMLVLAMLSVNLSRFFKKL